MCNEVLVIMEEMSIKDGRQSSSDSQTWKDLLEAALLEFDEGQIAGSDFESTE
jgi:hypothetical protein